MKYKNINKQHHLIIDGIFDKYQININDDHDFQQMSKKEELKDSIEKLEVLMGVYDYNDEDKLENDSIKNNFGNISIEGYYDALKNELYNFDIYSQYLPTIHIEIMFTSALIIQKLSDFLSFNSDEIPQDPDDPGYDQSPLKYGLYTLYTCAKRSEKLCKQILNHGVLVQIRKFLHCFNKECRIIAYSIFAEICKKGNFGQVSERDFIIQLAEKLLTVESYNENEEETSQFSQLYFAFNALERIYDEEENEYQFRRIVSEKALLILNEDLRNCFNSALKGLNDLVNNCTWFIYEYDDLIDFIYDIFKRQPNTEREKYIVTLLISLYKRLPINCDDDTEVYEKFIGKFHEVTQNNINIIANLINEQKKYSIELCTTIISVYPDFLLNFADNYFLGSLYDYYSNSNFEIKNAILTFLAHSLNYQDDIFNEALFNNLIGKCYVSSLTSIDPNFFDFKLILKGLLSALTLNPEIVLPIIYDIEDVEDLYDVIPSDPEEEQLLKELFEICFPED